MRLLAASVLMMAAAQAAQAEPVAQTAEAVLEANHAAMGAVPQQGALRLDYALSAGGLTGEATRLEDLASGAFAQSSKTDLVSGANGFDGKTPWQTDVSGVSTDQDGGDRVPVAVNEAYRNANLWWRGDRGGAAIDYVGRETENGRAVDHLAVTPRGGGRFEAYFDADTHLLMRTTEPQQFFKTQTLYGDYRPEQGLMLAHTRAVDFGTGDSNIERYTLRQAKLSDVRALSAYARPQGSLAGGRIDGGAASVTVPFRLLNNHVYVQVLVNGKGPYTFIVDTGGHTLMSPQLADALGLNTKGESANSGAGEGTSTTGYAHYDEIALGAVKLTDQTAFITKIYDRDVEGIPVDGMVGFELFARFPVRIDYGARTMTIYDPSRFDPAGAGEAIRFKFYDHLPFVDGFIDDLPAHFDIDTGSRAEVDVTSPSVAKMKLRERYRPGVTAITGWGVGGPARSYVVRIPSMTLGKVKMPSVVASLSEAKAGSFSDPNYQGNVGSGFLKRFSVTFDYAHQTMYLKPLAPQPEDAGRFDRSGLWINAADAGFSVTAVAPGGPAEQAGVAQGDLITAIDGKPVRPEGLSDARIRLRALPPGTKVTLALRRGSAERSATVVLRDLI